MVSLAGDELLRGRAASCVPQLLAATVLDSVAAEKPEGGLAARLPASALAWLCQLPVLTSILPSLACRLEGLSSHSYAETACPTTQVEEPEGETHLLGPGGKGDECQIREIAT